MLPELLQKASHFSLLHRIDMDLARQHQQGGCPYCGGPLHQANYPRKPRGGPDAIPEECLLRFSLCCGREGCRRRSLPPSTRFMERRVYWRCVILVAMTLRQKRPDGMSANKLSRLLGLTLPRRRCHFALDGKTSLKYEDYRISVFRVTPNNPLSLLALTPSGLFCRSVMATKITHLQ